MVKFDIGYEAIGFQDYWLEVQGYNRNDLLKNLVDSCFEKGGNHFIFGITSKEINRNLSGIHHRFRYLSKQRKELEKRNEGYKFLDIGENSFVVEKDGKIGYFINVHGVITEEGGRRIDYLIVGPNIHNGLSLEESLRESEGSIKIAENPFSSYGLGWKLLEKYKDNFHALSWNSQFIIPEVLLFVPHLKGFSKGKNNEAIEFSNRNNLNLVTLTDSHRVQDVFVSGIEINLSDLRLNDENSLFTSLGEVIRGGYYWNNYNYQDILGWYDWVSKFIIGLSNRERFGV